ncbi:sugar ABC transporter ATP-binding protein [Pseudonocardia kujensis]|uniref:sugar ABC transporter ATP-binding protein n=1 Tax=Pseudonocardia kujensis TaxID=1128675 RepID=UPI001E402C8F|nr:sugar ABC transporter ATP-binding protein [Pseudonocardia kujensis]MCE0764759.1 sugar ABC transporter ATP-binding protein [Pseudonocardia kujensis]
MTIIDGAGTGAGAGRGPAAGPAAGPARELVVTGLEKAYGRNQVLRGVDLTARFGTVHALLGENGAGKSTLIKILGGVTRQDAGTVSLGGRKLPPGGVTAAQRAGVRVVFQELSSIANLSVAENLLYRAEPHRAGVVAGRRLQRRAAELLARFGMDRLDPGRRVADLDLAERQLLEVVKALAAEPRVLVLDEATSALSSADSSWVLDQGRQAAARGCAVLLITHRLGEVRDVADRLTVLRSGTTVLVGRPDEFDDDTMITEMLGRRVERLFPPRTPPGEDVVVAVRGGRVGERLGPLDLEVRAGEIAGLGGLQGQGQREVLRALAGATRWTGGEVTVRGREHHPATPAEAIRAGITYVPEDRQREGLLLTRSVLVNSSLSSLFSLVRRGLLDRRREAQRSRAVAGDTGLPEGRLHAPVSMLSGGNQQKVVLARALYREPTVLLLHDCTRGVDVGTKADIFALVAGLAAKGTGVVFYSSDLSELAHFCDRVYVMAEGRVRGRLDAAGGELSEESILRLALTHRADDTGEEAPAP